MNKISIKKKELMCNAEIYLVKHTSINKPILSWKRVYDLQDEISYVIEFNGVEYNNNIIFIDENTANWEVPFELVNGKIYQWRVKAFDGYEYSDYSKTQYIQYKNSDNSSLMSFINVKTSKRYFSSSDLNSQMDVKKTVFNSSVGANIYVDKVKRFLPSEINISISPQMFLSSLIDVKKRNIDFLYSEIFIKTRKMLPPKGPLLVEMQSDFDFSTGNQKPLFSWWKSLDELFYDNITYEIQIDNSQFFINPLFCAKNIKNSISEQMVYPLPEKLDQDTYYWRIRSTDGINDSEWVYGVPFTIDYTYENIEAEINVVKKLLREDLVSEVVVEPKKILFSEVEVYGIGNSFVPCFTTVWSKTNEQLLSELYIYVGNAIEQLNSEVYVEYKFSDLLNQKSRIYVYPVETLECELDLCQKLLYGELHVLKEGLYTSKDNLFAEIEVQKIETLNSQIEVYHSQLNSEIYVEPTDAMIFMCSEIEVLKNVIFAEVDVYNARAEESISSYIEVYSVEKSELISDVTVLSHKEEYLDSIISVFKQSTISNVSARINVVKTIYFEAIENIFAEMNVIKKPETLEKTEKLLAKINVSKRIFIEEHLKSELNVLYKEYFDLNSELDVKSQKMLPVNVFSNQESNQWYNNNEIYFWWEVDDRNKDVVCGYIMEFNQDPDYIPELGKDYYEHNHGTNMFKAEVYDNSGEYYFHILSFDKHYRLSPVFHYKILYNNKPDAPENLRINNKILIQENKFISKSEKNIFSWDKSFDKDQNDFNNIKYEFMICDEPNFEYPDYISELLEDNSIELSFNYNNFSGLYYCRVRAFDGKEYSEWSKIYSFFVNTAPTTPSDISFFEK